MTREEAIDRLDKLSGKDEMEELTKEIYDDYFYETTTQDLGYSVDFPCIGRLAPNTKYRIYIEAYNG